MRNFLRWRRTDYHGGRITVGLPKGRRENGSRPNGLGLDGEQTLGSGRMLRILIEKDFQCLDTRKGLVEDEIARAAYPNPSADANRQKAG